MRAGVTALLAFTIACGGSPAAETHRIPGGVRAICEGLTVDLVDASAAGRMELMGLAADGPMRIALTDGRTGEALPAPAFTDAQADGARASLSWHSGPLTGAVDVVAPAAGIELTVTVVNPAAEQRWLELQTALPAPLAGGAGGWDGLDEFDGSGRREGIAGGFPMLCAWDDTRGIALGLQPHALIGDMTAEVRPADDRQTLMLAVKLVIDPGDEVSVPMVAYAFEPRFEWRDALQRYYDLYPASFWPAEGVTPDVWGTGGYIRTGDVRIAWEEARRLRFGWDWGYGLYRFAGDWYPHEEFYDGEYGPLEEYRAGMRSRFERYNAVAAGLSYVLLQIANLDLLQEHFPDAIERRADGSLRIQRGRHVKADEVTSPAFYRGNSLAEHSLQCFTELAEKRGVGGIAFDNAFGHHRRYGPGPENSPARAWQTEPPVVWAPEGSAFAGHMDHAHSLRAPDGHTLMVAANGVYSYLTAFRADAALHESPPYHNRDRLDAMRRLMGHKPIVCWEDNPGGYLKFEEMTRDELREALRGTYDFWVMYCLHRGLIPSARQLRGNRILQRHLDDMLTVMRAGWQPVPAMRADRPLWMARFGSGVGTILTLGNATGADCLAQVRVGTAYLGRGAFGFVPLHGPAGLRAEMSGGEAVLSMPIANRTTSIIRAPLQLLGADELVAECTRFPIEATVPDTIRWELETPAGAQATLRHWLPEGTELSAVRVGGEDCAFEHLGGAVQCEAALPAGAATVEIDLVPPVEIPRPEAIREFGFIDGGLHPACAIVIPDDAPERIRFAAERLAAYFEYWTAAQRGWVNKPGLLAAVEGRALLPIVSASEAPADGTPLVRLCLREAGDTGRRTSPAAARLVPGDPTTLVIEGESAEAVHEATLAVLGILDGKYDFPGWLELTGEIFHAAGVARGVIE